MYGIEVLSDQNSVQSFSNTVQSLKQTVNVFDHDDDYIIVFPALYASDVDPHNSRNIGDTHPLILLENETCTSLFSDYGFQTNSFSYLFKDMVSSFYFTSGKEEEIAMAILQMDDCLLAVEHGVKECYFIDKEYRPFVEKVGKAYDIEVSFLDLDKL